MRIVREKDVPRMPWKNGGGETAEVAVFPPDAGFADFGWRISMASVAREGPFSRFEGIDRTLMLTEGSGLVLVLDGAEHRLDRASAPLRFAGEAAAEARPTSGPVRDLNVMTRRDTFAHRVGTARLANGTVHRMAAGQGETKVLVALGPCRVIAYDASASLERLDTLLLGPGESAGIEALADVVVAHIVIRASHAGDGA